MISTSKPRKLVGTPTKPYRSTLCVSGGVVVGVPLLLLVLLLLLLVVFSVALSVCLTTGLGGGIFVSLIYQSNSYIQLKNQRTVRKIK